MAGALAPKHVELEFKASGGLVVRVKILEKKPITVLEKQRNFVGAN